MTKDELPCPVVITFHFVGQKPRSLLSLVTTYSWQVNTLSVVPGTKYIYMYSAGNLQILYSQLQQRRQNCKFSLQEQMKSSLNIWFLSRQQLLYSCEESQGRHPNSLRLEYLS